MRRRIAEFLSEIGFERPLPARHDVYRARYLELFQAMQGLTRPRSQLLHDFMCLGAMTVLYVASGELVTPEHRKVLRRRWVPLLERYGVNPVTYTRFAAGASRIARSRDASALLSQAFEPLEDLLHPVARERSICFVAMPFQAPFLDYFRTYYRSALAQAGFSAIRAWGGIGAEEYYPFVGTLISRCGAVLAELGTLNLNVINEIGLAHGNNIPVFLVMRDQHRGPPSNLARLAVFRYPATGTPPGRDDVARLERFVRWIWKDYRRSLTAAGVIRMLARDLIGYLRIAGRPVPADVVALTGPRPSGTQPARRHRTGGFL
jgi:hypothetical protein